MWEWSAEVLDSVCDHVVFAVPAGYEQGEGPWRVTGGASRSESVSFALDAAADAEIVVIHDAARPLVTRDLVERCIAEVRAGWDGAVAASPMVETVKETDGHGRVRMTLDRSSLWSIQTPQAFRAAALRDALGVPPEVLAAATDDAALVEAAGGSVRVVEAPRENLKITVPLDLQLAELLLSERC